MIKVFVKKQSNYPVKATELKKKLSEFFKKQGIVSDAFVSVALIGEEKMLDLSKKYLKDNMLHSVLSFSPDEVKGLSLKQSEFHYPPDDKLDLGEIVICFPVALEEAKKEGKRINAKIEELMLPAALHLLGIHHE